MKIKIILFLVFAFFSSQSIAQLETVKLFKKQQAQKLIQKEGSTHLLPNVKKKTHLQNDQTNWANLAKNWKNKTAQQGAPNNHSNKEVNEIRPINQNTNFRYFATEAPPAAEQWNKIANAILPIDQEVLSIEMVDDTTIWMTSTSPIFLPELTTNFTPIHFL